MKNLKYLICFIMGVLLTISINIVGASIESSGIMYNSKSLNTVLDDLYSKINIGDAASNQILSGKTALVKGTKVTGTMANQSALTHAISVGTNGTNKYFRIPTGAYLTLQSTGYPEIYASATEIDSNIKAENIKKGVSIAGIKGTYTSDATATASNILSGKTAYVNGSKLTGTHTSLNHTYKIVDYAVENHLQANGGSSTSFSYTATAKGKVVVYYSFTGTNGNLESVLNYSIKKNGTTVTKTGGYQNAWNAGIYYTFDVNSGDAIVGSASLPSSAGHNSVSQFVVFVS